LALEARGACGPGLYCNFETVTEKACAIAKYVPDPAIPSPSLEGRFLDEASNAPVAAAPESDSARASALRDAAEFGMIGLLNPDDADGAGRGEGIGLGDIGTICYSPAQALPCSSSDATQNVSTANSASPLYCTPGLASWRCTRTCIAS
jgi:hypothetical protein